MTRRLLPQITRGRCNKKFGRDRAFARGRARYSRIGRGSRNDSGPDPRGIRARVEHRRFERRRRVGPKPRPACSERAPLVLSDLDVTLLVEALAVHADDVGLAVAAEAVLGDLEQALSPGLRLLVLIEV